MRYLALLLALVATPAMACQAHEHTKIVKDIRPPERRDPPATDCLETKIKALVVSYCEDVRIELRKTFQF